MGRFILRFTGRGTPSDADLARVRSAPGITVVDDSSPRMLLIQASPQAVSRLAKALPDWVHTSEQMIPLPETRPSVRST
jgi:hypothetical protein